jgi:hypothetical protein
MTAELVVDAVRVGWLTLAFMMLLSRFVFQAMGPVWMRSFLDGWQDGGVKRLWGAASLAFAAFLVAGSMSAGGELDTFDVVLLAALLAILVADGLVNVLPSGFAAFKDRMQEAWVARRRGSGREDDRHLFGTVNLLLGLAALGVAVVVIAYKPITAGLLGLATALAVVLTLALIGLSRRAGSGSAARSRPRA